MTSRLRSVAAAAALLLVALPSPDRASAQGFSAEQRGEIERIIRDYLIKNPDVMQDVLVELEKRQATADAEKHQSAIKDNAKLLFNSTRHVVLGNPQGDVTMVEFFDYNCGYCKRALADMLDLMKADPKLRVVLKEFPVLGQGSVEAAQVSTAVGIQDKSGRKYLEFHQKLLGGRGQIDKARALAAAKDAGLDMSRLEKDMAGPEIRASLEESFKLAEALGLNGTPSYVVGNNILIGAVGRDALMEKINTTRCGKAMC